MLDPEHVSTQSPKVPVLHRLVSAMIAAACAAVIGVAAWLPPSPNGVGTHTGLGLPPCSWVEYTDFPCPTCGMTTAFAFAADARFTKSFLTQPMGFVLAILTVMTFWVSLFVAVTGSRLGLIILGLWRPSMIWFFGGLALASWVYKIVTFAQG